MRTLEKRCHEGRPRRVVGLPELPRRPCSDSWKDRQLESAGGLMKPRALTFLVCPVCTSEFDLAADSWDGNEVLEGRLSCRQCDLRYPIRAGVPRFVPDGAYASSFGYQWKAFREVQLDSRNGTSQSADTLDGTVGWPQGK